MHKILTLSLLWFSLFLFSQESENHSAFFYFLKNKEFLKAKESIKQDSLKLSFFKLVDVIYSEGQLYDYDKFKVNFKFAGNIYEEVLEQLSFCYSNIFYNKYELYEETKKELVKLLKVTEDFKNKELSKQVLIAIFSLYRKDFKQIDEDYLFYLKKYQFLIEDPTDYFYYIINFFVFQSKSPLPPDKLFHDTVRRMDSISKFLDSNSKLLPFYFFEKGIYNSIMENRSEAKKDYEKVLIKTDDSPFFRYINYGALLKTSQIYHKDSLYNEAFSILKKANKYEDLTDTLLTSKYYYYLYGSEYYEGLKKIDSAYFFLKKSNEIENKVEPLENKFKRSEAQVKFETLEKELENQQLRSKRKQDRFIILTVSILLILGGTIAYLNLKNSRKKRLLAEQQKELEKQKNLTLIKEQEIHTINAMIDGQEKERIRIAEDLHDNIGSVLATLKLHFENLKLNREKKHFNQEELYNKTEKLIDETYLKVRSIAHAKNAGVIANQGLLVVIKIMAEKISAANQIKIYVVDYGLDNRLENSVEITVFRIIQELTTNIIKHANASEATINISQFDNSLNIIIEDDGKGFDVENTTFKSGIGIASIQKRIQHLQGTFQIDSTLEKGTSIIINIPIMNT